MSMSFSQLLSQIGAPDLEIRVDADPWRELLTPEEADKVDDILDFVDTFKDSLGEGSLASIIYKLAEGCKAEVASPDAQSEPKSVEAPEKIKHYLAQGAEVPFTTEELGQLHYMATTAQISTLSEMRDTLICRANNVSGVRILKGYDGTVLRLVTQLQKLMRQREIKAISAAAHGATLALPTNLLDKAKFLYDEYTRDLLYSPRWDNLSSQQREGWLRVAAIV